MLVRLVVWIRQSRREVIARRGDFRLWPFAEVVPPVRDVRMHRLTDIKSASLPLPLKGKTAKRQSARHNARCLPSRENGFAVGSKRTADKLKLSTRRALVWLRTFYLVSGLKGGVK